ncbi:YwmB family TATA-box binding protein [Paenibacillus rigui]|uniref:TATA-box binding protein n=1 Tax=Paenibacillus rigui TaxID=554312 RepID=A0A229UPP2_9BACL|nr:YwmB family TATA-box binding protein [Paenibacillus rigui]OXM84869.1 hypothetical protein CF651_18355 [Paenibacillus rigui]
MKRSITLILVAFSLLIGAWAVHVQAQTVQTAGSASLQLLLPVSKQAIGTEPHLILKHTSTYKTYPNEEEFLRIGQELSRTFGMPEQTVFTREQDHLLYKSEAALQNHVQFTLTWIGYADGTTTFMMTAQTEDGAASEASEQSMVQLQQQLSGKLQELGLAPHWNVILQGTLSDTFADTEQDQLSVYRWLSEQLQLKEVGRYQDKGSTSISYYSQLLPAEPQIKNTQLGQMNVQIAIHRNSVTKERRITIGTPAISVEY